MRNAVAGLALLPLFLLPSAGCVHSRPHLIRNAFASSYWCPVNQIDVRAEPGTDRFYRVVGCGLEVTYDCGGAGDSGECHARERVEYEATDGTPHGAWLDDNPSANVAMSREAAIASGAHDLPCDRASLQVVGGDPSGLANVIEGCGQRITYMIVDVADQPTTEGAPSEPVKKHKYVVVRRAPLTASPAPATTPPAASGAPAPATAPAPSPAPAPAPAPTSAPAPAPAPTPAPSAAPNAPDPLSTPR